MNEIKQRTCMIVIQRSEFEQVNYDYSCNLCNWPIDSPPSCPGIHDLRIAYLNTYHNMKAISLHYNITDQLSD